MRNEPTQQNGIFLAGEPNFNGPPLHSYEYRSYIESGTYVGYLDNNSVPCFGRIVSISVGFPCPHLSINLYVDIETLRETARTFDIIPLQNPYVELCKLVQTSTLVHCDLLCVTGLIFVLKKDEIINGVYPCEGMEMSFVLRYQYIQNQFYLIPDTECLPFHVSTHTAE